MGRRHPAASRLAAIGLGLGLALAVPAAAHAQSAGADAAANVAAVDAAPLPAAPPVGGGATGGGDQRPAAPPVAPSGKAPRPVVIGVLAALGAGGLGALVFINSALGRTKTWSLSDAVSEEVSLPIRDAQGAIVLAGDAPVLAPVLVASTSRLIALYGLFAILILYLGFGFFVLWDVATGQNLPASLGQVQGFLITGLTLFAPYLVNQFAGVFSGLTPRS